MGQHNPPLQKPSSCEVLTSLVAPESKICVFCIERRCFSTWEVGNGSGMGATAGRACGAIVGRSVPKLEDEVTEVQGIEWYQS